jgi:hypothetical protein
LCVGERTGLPSRADDVETPQQPTNADNEGIDGSKPVEIIST